MKHLDVIPIITALTLGLTTPLAAGQEGPPGATASVGVTLMSAGPGHAAGDALKQMGFDDPHGRRPSPASSTKVHFFAQSHVRVGERRALGMVVTGVRGHTERVRADPDTARTERAYADYAIDTQAVLYSRWVTNRLRIGAGPALHTARIVLSSSTGRSVDLGRQRSVGWIGDVSLNIPVRERPFRAVEVSLQRRQAPSRNLAAQTLTAQNGGEPSGTLTWPAMRTNFSHWMIGVGLGFRY